MTTIADSSAWSLFLRRRPGANLSDREMRVRELVRAMSESGSVLLVGVVRQEVLSGISDNSRFRSVRDFLRTHVDTPMVMDDYEAAADYYNICRRGGVTPTQPDMLICAVAARLDADILSTDGDFIRYAQHLPVRLHPLSAPLS